MKRLSHTIWLARWLQRLSTALVRGRKILDLVPSVLSPRRRHFYDRRVRGMRSLVVRRTLSDYWAYDQCIASTGLDLDRFPQGLALRARYERMLAAGRTPLVLDCGANIGCSAYWLAVEFPRARIIAVEPDEDNVRLVQLNTRQCGNVEVVKGAVAAEDCRMVLANTGQGSDAFRTEVATTGEVVGYSIASLLAKGGGTAEDLLLAKIDIEGFESQLFERNTEWVDQAGGLIVETHDWMLPGQATATPLLRALSRTSRDFLVHGEHVLSFRL